MECSKLNNFMSLFIHYYDKKSIIYLNLLTDVYNSFSLSSGNQHCSIYINNTVVNSSSSLAKALYLTLPLDNGFTNNADSGLDNRKFGSDDRPSPLQVWGLGFLCVTVINLCALLGIIFLPFMGHKSYKLLMNFMIALAVGSLLTTSVMVLMPEALGLDIIHALIKQELNETNHRHIIYHSGEHDLKKGWKQFDDAYSWYIWRVCTIFAGVYGFFLLERALKEFLNARNNRSKSRQQPDLKRQHTCSMNLERQPRDNHDIRYAPPASTSSFRQDHCDCLFSSNGDGECDDDAFLSNSHHMTPKVSATNGHDHGHSHTAQPPTITELVSNKTVEVEDDMTSISKSKPVVHKGLFVLKHVAPVAWMIILGDGIHNFIDGLGIGAAFSTDTASGFSISLAVLCEELPHELGDFAILLTAGMSMKQALFFNFLSALFCYVGFVLGVIISEAADASVWIFAIAAGMFLYISLVDMLPEMNSSMEGAEAKELGKCRVFLLQNFGLLTGFGVILVLSLYSDYIRL